MYNNKTSVNQTPHTKRFIVRCTKESNSVSHREWVIDDRTLVFIARRLFGRTRVSVGAGDDGFLQLQVCGRKCRRDGGGPQVTVTRLTRVLRLTQTLLTRYRHLLVAAAGAENIPTIPTGPRESWVSVCEQLQHLMLFFLELHLQNVF